MDYNLSELIKEFLEQDSRYKYKIKKETACNILRDGTFSLLSIAGNSHYIDLNYLQENIKDAVRSNMRSKGTAIWIFKAFIKFIEDKTGVQIDVKYPPIDSSSTFERRMYLVKRLHPNNQSFIESEESVKDLAELLWVDEKTIRNDLRILRGESENEEELYYICGKKFFVPGIGRKKNDQQLHSTVHPLFLTSNLTQVFVTLKGLKILSQNALFAEYANQMAKDIWGQLSDYAKSKILYLCETNLPDEKNWYESLESDDDYFFHSEVDCDNNGPNCALSALKNGRLCTIVYKNKTGKTVRLKDCLLLNSTGDTIDVKTGNTIKTLEIDRIIQSAYSLNV